MRAEIPFRVEWNNLDAYGLKRSATKEAVPFLRMPDGGLVALWYHAEEPAVVHIGAHGEWKVLASDFEDFLKGINARSSGLPDIDEGNVNVSIPGVRGRPNRAGFPDLQEKFDQWFKGHTSLLAPLGSPEAEALRQRVYTLSSPWWSMDFHIERNGENLSITYLDFGEWHPVPTQYKLAKEVPELLQLVKNKKRRSYELSIGMAGTISIDRDRELLLVPPERKTN